MTDEFWKRKSLSDMSRDEWESLCDCARARLVSSCLVLSVNEPEAFSWLPGSCAYRRLSEGKELPAWHPLVTGDPGSVHDAGISARGKAVSELEKTEHSVLRSLDD